MGEPRDAGVAEGLERIIEAAAGVLAAQSLPATLEAMADALHTVIPYTSLAVYEVDRAAGHLVPLLATGLWVEETMASRPSLQTSITGRAILSREVIALEPNDPIRADHVMPGTPEEEGEAFLVAPLLVFGEPVGSLNVWREHAHARFTGDEVRLCKSFAALAAMTYVNARQRDQLRDAALTDPLTGAYNRRHFEERMQEALARARRHDEPAGLAVLDIDDFKQVNDVHGHPAGDRVLCDFAAILREQSREDDVICRIGGEEFAVIHPGGDADAVRAWCERVLAALREAGVGPSGRLTASAGLTITRGEEDADAVFSRADAQLLEAKRAGKDRCAGP